MKKIIITAVVTALLVCVNWGRVSAQEIISAGVSRDTILIGDQVEWGATLRLPRGMQVSIDPMAGYAVPGVELIRDMVVDTLKLKRKFMTVDAKAIVTSFDSGAYVLPPLVMYVSCDDTVVDTLRLPSIPLMVQTIPVDTATFELYDIRPQFTYPVTFMEVLPWSLGSLALIAGVVMLVVFLQRRRREPSDAQMPKYPAEAPEVVALRELNRITEKKLWQAGRQKQFYTELTDTLRVYIERRFGVKTMERTTNEILADLDENNSLTDNNKETLRDLLSTADLVKFAKYKATDSENEQAVPVAVRFVNDTTQHE